MSRAHFLAIALSLVLVLPRLVRPAEAVRVWTELALEAPLSAGTRGSLRHESRWVDDLRRYGLHNYDLGLAWSPPRQRFSVALHFTQEFQRSGDRFLAESRPYADVLFRNTIREAELSWRTRVELRLFRDRRDRVRLRERIQLLLPYSLWRGGPQLFASEEVLFESDDGDLDQNRAVLGLVARWGALTASVYGMVVSEQREHWEHAPVFGLGLTWSFAGRPVMSGDP